MKQIIRIWLSPEVVKKISKNKGWVDFVVRQDVDGNQYVNGELVEAPKKTSKPSPIKKKAK